ncbi:hypothetical protein ACSSWA_03815 [Melioribacter sp. Ez-97]|uniref:hypothetical protein n=1 Tax=Melioribacter sp. Ez-97 TaxID=3423434 RepID=UPI003ED8417F
MDKDNLTEIISFKASLDENNTITLPEGVLDKIKNNNISEFFVTIYYDAKRAAFLDGFSEERVDKIKNTQGIPYSSVYDFLKAKGSLNKENFGKGFIWY